MNFRTCKKNCIFLIKEKRNIFLIGIREINNDLPIDELTLSLDNEILNDENWNKYAFCYINIVNNNNNL
jgi:hypothetical protein